jgi:hypothetical protein
VSSLKRDTTACLACPCENFLYAFKAAPRGRSRRRRGAQAVALLTLRSGRADAGRLARRARVGAAEVQAVTRAAADLTREPSRRPSSGSCGQARSQPDPRASVRAAAPFQIRRSVRAELTAVVDALLCKRQIRQLRSA